MLVTKSDAAIEDIFGPREEWSGNVRLFREVLLYRLSNFLRLEKEHAQGRLLLGLEVQCEIDLDLEDGRRARVKGIIDRVEKENTGMVRVIDYKTGSKIKSPGKGDPAGISDREAMKHEIVSFQLPLYLLLSNRHYGLGSAWSKMNAVLYKLRGLTDSSNLKALQTVLFNNNDNSSKIVKECYIPALKTLIREILDPGITFAYDYSRPDYCASCPYRRRICKIG